MAPSELGCLVSSKRRTVSLSPATDGTSRSPHGDKSMNGQTEIIPIDAKRHARIFNVGFLIISTVAMIGWLTALGWAAMRFAGWLLF
jgi:hypothetical protein